MSLKLAYPVRPYRKFYVAAGYLDKYYYDARKKYHKGIDLNLRTGKDTDFGYPVQAMFPGEVIGASSHSGWGGIVLVRAEGWVKEWVGRRLGRYLDCLDAQYAHLGQISVEKGMKVGAGDHLGSIGKGDNNQFFAHLHLELRCRALPVNDPQSGDDGELSRLSFNYLDPGDFISTLPFSDFGSILPPRRQAFVTDYLGVEGGQYPLQSPRIVLVNRVDSKIFVRTEEEDVEED